MANGRAENAEDEVVEGGSGGDGEVDGGDGDADGGASEAVETPDTDGASSRAGWALCTETGATS